MVLEDFKQALTGKPVSHVWHGHGSALFLEFGELTPHIRRDGSFGNPTSEITLMIEWNWRIERPKSILGGSWSSARRWPCMFEKLKNATVTTVKFFGALPKIEVSLSNGLKFVLFMTAEASQVGL